MTYESDRHPKGFYPVPKGFYPVPGVSKRDRIMLRKQMVATCGIRNGNRSDGGKHYPHSYPKQDWSFPEGTFGIDLSLCPTSRLAYVREDEGPE